MKPENALIRSVETRFSFSSFGANALHAGKGDAMICFIHFPDFGKLSVSGER